MLEGAADGFMTGAITGFISGGLSSSQCFVAGTAILAASGHVLIEDIAAGDYVWATDPETGETGLRRVVQTFENEANELIHVYVNGEEIVTTREHPFYSPVKGWTAACELGAGDMLVLVNGEYVVVEKVQHELLENPVKVYNFEVEDFHTYYVGGTGVLVHNLCDPKLSDFSTGRSTPNNLYEKLSMESAKSNPLGGDVIMKNLSDPRLPSGAVKMQQVFNTSKGKIVIHYIMDTTKNLFFDFKFK